MKIARLMFYYSYSYRIKTQIFIGYEILCLISKIIDLAQEFQCHLCEKAYPRADTLKRHILAFHEGKKMYKCEVDADLDFSLSIFKQKTQMQCDRD